MAPFYQAIQPVFSHKTSEGGWVYRGQVDGEWAIGAVPHGGYVLALILSSCLSIQSETTHKDIIHVSAHYLRATSVDSYEVHINRLRVGKGFSNLTANLIQKNQTTVMVHLICGTFPDPENPNLSMSPSLTLKRPSPFARRPPFTGRPSLTEPSIVVPKFTFRNYLNWAHDTELMDKCKNPGESGQLEWGAWLELTDPKEVINVPTLAFFADIFENTPEMLARAQGKKADPSWYPTMVMNIEFKCAIPKSLASSRTVGIYCKSGFLDEGRHDAWVEVWTAPENVSDRTDIGSSTADWRDGMQCLAISTQMALTVPLSVNRKKKAKL